MAKRYFYFVALLMFWVSSSFSQSSEIDSGVIAQNTKKDCRVFLNGKLLNNPQPTYPSAAKIGGITGKVEVTIEIDESGAVTAIEKVNGDDFLKNAASEAALQAKFSPSLCDGVPAKTVGIITYNFGKIELTNQYFKPTKIEDLLDITPKLKHYEALLFLTEKYRIAFGYADQKYHPEMPLTKGDFVHYLRQTLEMLDSRAKLANKNLLEIRLYQPFNPNNLQEIELIPKSPFAESLKILSDKYRIVLAEKDGVFEGNSLLTKAEIIEIWRNIFSEEAIPVNFLFFDEKTQEMSRGDFALYLKESLDVLTYKVLP